MIDIFDAIPTEIVALSELTELWLFVKGTENYQTFQYIDISSQKVIVGR